MPFRAWHSEWIPVLNHQGGRQILAVHIHHPAVLERAYGCASAPRFLAIVARVGDLDLWIGNVVAIKPRLLAEMDLDPEYVIT